MPKGRIYRSKIVGVTFDDPVSGLNRQEIIRSYLRPNHLLHAIYEPDNPHGESAIGLWLEFRPFFRRRIRYHLGYLPHNTAEKLLPHFRRRSLPKIRVSEITGGSVEKPTLGVNLTIQIP